MKHLTQRRAFAALVLASGMVVPFASATTVSASVFRSTMDVTAGTIALQQTPPQEEPSPQAVPANDPAATSLLSPDDALLNAVPLEELPPMEQPNIEDRLQDDLATTQAVGTSVDVAALEATALAEATAAGPSLAVVDTNYPIPSGARFVSPTGNDSNAGTLAAPWRTVRKAVSASSSGTTVVIRGGTYREGNISLGGKRLTLQPYPHEQVWLKGSVVVTGWVQDGSMWRKDGWNYQFRRGLPSNFTYPEYPLAAYPDIVFIDGAPLKQVGSKTQVTSGTFFVDYGARKLYIGSNPGGKTVEGGALSQALRITNASGTIVRGLGFQHYATHRDQFGAVHTNTPRLLFENNTFAYNAAQGLSILDPDAVVRSNTFLYNGQMGLHGYQADRLLVERNRLAFNNQEHFRWETGGAKLTASRDMVIRDNLFDGNIGKGLWTDVSCYNTTIVRNVTRNNTMSGIMYEISAKAVIASNVVTGNGDFGIYLSESENIDVYNNTLSRNKVNIRIFEGRHTNSDSLITHDVRDVVVRNNILSNAWSTSTEGLLSVDDVRNILTAEEMGVSVNYNAYYRTNSSVPATEMQWSRGENGVTNFRSFDAFRSGTTQERSGLGIDNVATNPFFVDEGAGNYQLKTTSVARGKGTPLPSHVASAIGVPAGVPVDLGALRW